MSTQTLLKDIDSKLITITKGLNFHNNDIITSESDIIVLYNLIEIVDEIFFIDVSKYDQYLCLLYKKDSFDKSDKLLFNIINNILIFNIHGKLYSQIQIQSIEDVVCCQFLNNSHIALLKNNGYCEIYTITGVLIKQLKLIYDIQQQKSVTFGTIVDDNIAAICMDNSICYAENISRRLYNSKNAHVATHSFISFVNDKLSASGHTDKTQCKLTHSILIPKGQYTHDTIMYQSVLITVIRATNTSQDNSIELLVLTYLKDNISQCYLISELTNNDKMNEVPLDLAISSMKTCQVQPQILLFDKQNSLLLLINLHNTFENEDPPVIEIVQPMVYQQNVIFDFIYELPCYFNDMTNTLLLVLPTKSGNKIKEILVQNIIIIKHNKNGITTFTIGYQKLKQIQHNIGDNIDIFSSGHEDQQQKTDTVTWGENKQVYQIDQLTIASSLYVQVFNNEAIDETKSLNAFLHYRESENDIQVINICEQELQQIKSLNNTILNLFQLMYDCSDLQIAALILQTIAFIKIYLPPEQQFEITQRFDIAKKILRLGYDLFANTTKLSIKLSDIKDALEKTQYLQLIMDILCSGGYYENALKILGFLDSDVSNYQIIMMHKSIVFVLKNTQLSDDIIFQTIHENILKTPQITKQLADYLTKVQDRQKVVQMLIEKETNEDDQIQILLESHNYQQAIIKSYLASNEGMIVEALIQGFKNTSQEQLIKQLLEDSSNQQSNIKQHKSQHNILNISNMIIQQMDILNIMGGFNQNHEQTDPNQRLKQYLVNLLKHHVYSYTMYSIKLQNLSTATNIENNNNLVFISDSCQNKRELLDFQLAKIRFNNQKITEIATFELQQTYETASCNLGIQLYKYLNAQSKVFSEYEELKATTFDNISLVSVLKRFGYASITKLIALNEKQNYQVRLQNFAPLLQLKQFISMLGKDIQLSEAQMHQFVCYGLIDALSDKLKISQFDIQQTARFVSTGTQLLHEFINGASKTIQKQIAGQVLQYMSRKVTNSQSNIGLQNMLIQHADKRETLKAGMFQGNHILINKTKDGYLENQLLSLSIQSISRDVQDKIIAQ